MVSIKRVFHLFLIFNLCPSLGVSQPPLREGILLIARPSLNGSSFQQTVILLVHYHEKKGAMGLNLNRQSNYHLSEIRPGLSNSDTSLFSGGPVSPSTISLLLFSQSNYALKSLGTHIYFDNHSHSLAHILKNRKKDELIQLYSGYAGWHAGQLESEIKQGAWLVVPATAKWIFKHPKKQLWSDLIKHWSGTWL